MAGAISGLLESADYEHKEQLISVLGLVLKRVLQAPNHCAELRLLAVAAGGAWLDAVGALLGVTELLIFGLAIRCCSDPQLQSKGGAPSSMGET